MHPVLGQLMIDLKGGIDFGFVQVHDYRVYDEFIHGSFSP